MTIIVWDGKTLAADRMADDNGQRRTMTKIKRHKDVLLAGTGTAAACGAVMNWFMNGARIDDFPVLPAEQSCDLWVINKSGAIGKFESCAYPVRFEDAMFACGDGAPYAYGVFEMGGTAVDAVKAAIKHCTSCGGSIDTLSFNV